MFILFWVWAKFRFLLKSLEVSFENFLSGIWIRHHWVPCRRSNRLSYQATSSTLFQCEDCTATSLSYFVRCRTSFWLLSSSVAMFFSRNFVEVIIWVWRNELIRKVFTTERFLEVAIEIWLELNLNPQLLTSIQTL